MSTENTASSGGAATSAPQKVVVEIASSQGRTNDGGLERISPEQFNQRLAEAERIGASRLLKRFGVKKDERAAVLADIEAGRYMLKPTPAADEPDYKAEYEKLKPSTEKVKQLEADLAEAHTLMKADFTGKFEKLPEPAKKLIEISTPKDDWRAQQKAMLALEASGMLAAIAAQGTTQTTTTQAQQRDAKPATTMAAPGPQTQTAEAKTAWQQYEALLKSGNKIMAAQYRSLHAHAIEATRPK